MAHVELDRIPVRREGRRVAWNLKAKGGWGREQAGRMGLTKEGMELDWNLRKRED